MTTDSHDDIDIDIKTLYLTKREEEDSLEWPQPLLMDELFLPFFSLSFCTGIIYLISILESRVMLSLLSFLLVFVGFFLVSSLIEILGDRLRRMRHRIIGLIQRPKHQMLLSDLQDHFSLETLDLPEEDNIQARVLTGQHNDRPLGVCWETGNNGNWLTISFLSAFEHIGPKLAFALREQWLREYGYFDSPPRLHSLQRGDRHVLLPHLANIGGCFWNQPGPFQESVALLKRGNWTFDFREPSPGQTECAFFSKHPSQMTSITIEHMIDLMDALEYEPAPNDPQLTSSDFMNPPEELPTQHFSLLRVLLGPWDERWVPGDEHHLTPHEWLFELYGNHPTTWQHVHNNPSTLRSFLQYHLPWNRFIFDASVAMLPTQNTFLEEEYPHWAPGELGAMDWSRLHETGIPTSLIKKQARALAYCQNSPNSRLMYEGAIIHHVGSLPALETALLKHTNNDNQWKTKDLMALIRFPEKLLPATQRTFFEMCARVLQESLHAFHQKAHFSSPFLEQKIAAIGIAIAQCHHVPINKRLQLIQSIVTNQDQHLKPGTAEDGLLVLGGFIALYTLNDPRILPIYHAYTAEDIQKPIRDKAASFLQSYHAYTADSEKAGAVSLAELPEAGHLSLSRESGSLSIRDDEE